MEKQGAKKMTVEVFSFGFKYGDPEEANYVFDVRFLPNPYWEERLREKTGLIAEVADYVLESEEAVALLQYLLPMVKFLIEENRKAGKEALRVGIGCTGGRHRSVAVVQKLIELLHAEGADAGGFHRDIEKDSL